MAWLNQLMPANIRGETCLSARQLGGAASHFDVDSIGVEAAGQVPAEAAQMKWPTLQNGMRRLLC